MYPRSARSAGVGGDKLRQCSGGGLQVVQALRKDNKPVVIDADGLHILKENLHLLKVRPRISMQGVLSLSRERVM